MGGRGSGRHGWHNKVEQFQSLDVRQVHREYRFERGLEASISIGGAAPITLQVDWTPCHFGGERPWWWCPRCGYRRAILYLAGSGFLCRVCLRLTYRSTCLDAAGRAQQKYCKIMCRLGGEGDFGEEIPNRPEGIPQRTYDRLCQQAEAALLAHERAFVEHVPAWLRRMMLEPK